MILEFRFFYKIYTSNIIGLKIVRKHYGIQRILWNY